VGEIESIGFKDLRDIGSEDAALERETVRSAFAKGDVSAAVVEGYRGGGILLVDPNCIFH